MVGRFQLQGQRIAGLCVHNIDSLYNPFLSRVFLTLLFYSVVTVLTTDLRERERERERERVCVCVCVCRNKFIIIIKAGHVFAK